MKGLRTTLVWGMLLCSPLLASAQEIEFKDADSLMQVAQTLEDTPEKVSVFRKLFQAYLYNDIDQAKHYVDKSLALATLIEDEAGIAGSLYNMGTYHYRNNDLDSANWYHNQALDRYVGLGLIAEQAKVNHARALVLMPLGKYEEALEILNANIDLYQTTVKDSMRLGVTYSIKAIIHIQKGNLNIALSDGIKSLRILEKLNNPLRIADTQKILAGVELSLKNYEQSLAYSFPALEVYREKQDKFYEAMLLKSIGLSYFGLEQYAEAIEYLKPGLELAREMKSENLETSALLQLGRCYRELGQFQTAIPYLTESLTFVRKTRSQSKIAETLIAFGKTYYQQNKPLQALPYFDQAIELADSFELKPFLYKGYGNRAKTYASLGNYQMAYQDYERFTVISDSIYNQTKSQQIQELRTLYDTEKKEQEIIQQQTDIALLEQQEKVSTLQKALLAMGLGVLALVAVLTYVGFRQKIKKTELEKEKIDLELDFKKKELTTQALHLARKNETLSTLRQKANELRTVEDNQTGYQQLISAINFDLKDDKNWENFARRFQEVHTDFYATVTHTYPSLTPNELRLMALLKMNLSSKEIANILNISMPGIKKARQRLRKKMGLSPRDSLEKAVMAL